MNSNFNPEKVLSSIMSFCWKTVKNYRHLECRVIWLSESTPRRSCWGATTVRAERSLSSTLKTRWSKLATKFNLKNQTTSTFWKLLSKQDSSLVSGWTNCYPTSIWINLVFRGPIILTTSCEFIFTANAIDIKDSKNYQIFIL